MRLERIAVLGSQFGYRDHLIAHLLKRRHHKLSRVGSCLKKIVHQDNRTILYSFDRRLER